MQLIEGLLTENIVWLDTYLLQVFCVRLKWKRIVSVLFCIYYLQDVYASTIGVYDAVL